MSIHDSSKHLTVSVLKKVKRVPGWNRQVKDAHNSARACFLEWVKKGRQRVGLIFERMKQTRNAFHRKLKECRRSEEKIRNDALFNSFKYKNMKKFWRDLHKAKGSGKKLPSIIDNKTNDPDISVLFQTKFSASLDKPSCQGHDNKFYDSMNSMSENRNAHVFTLYDVNRAINRLRNMGGPDGVHSNHFILAPFQFKYFVYILLNSFMKHSFVPEEMLVGQIRPSIKDKFGKI